MQHCYRTLVSDPGGAAPPRPSPPGSATCHAKLIDAFDAWAQDNPKNDHPRLTPWPEVAAAPGGTIGHDACTTVRTGGVDGTTWHNWGGAERSHEISEAMKASGVQHRTRALGGSGGSAGGPGGGSGGAGGGGGDGARGHQRHIDAILLSEQVWVSGGARVRRAWVDASACRSRKGACAAGLGADCDQCFGKGSWASDHLPVLADVLLFFDT